MGARTARGTRAGRAWLVAGAMLLTTMVAVAGAPAAQAATFVVDSTADTGDVAAGNGVCANGVGDCTVRAAIEEANALAGADTITVPAGTYPVALRLAVSDDLSIVGAGSGSTTLQATVDDTFTFEVTAAGVTLALTGLALDGAATDNGIQGDWPDTEVSTDDVIFRDYGNVPICLCGEEPGVALHVAETVFDDNAYSIIFTNAGGTVDVRDSTVRSHAYAMLVASAGGTFNLIDSTVTNVSSEDEPAGLEIYDGVNVTIRRSTISGNSDSGIIQFDESPPIGSVLLVDSEVDDNGVYGAILDGPTTILRSSISGNGQVGVDHGVGDLTIDRTTVAGNGYNGVQAVRGDHLSVLNTTISGNGVVEPENEWYGLGVGDYTSATIQNTTIVGAPVGLDPGYSAPLVVRNTIVAGTMDACSAPVPSAGHNLASGASCDFDATGDVVGAAKLGPLADNGGTTLTRMPASDSPAVDAGTGTGCPTTDQRGTTRPRDGDGDGVARCDIGAVERDGQAAATADLRLSKSADRDRAAIGELVTYTLTVRNAGPDAATGVRVTDPLPDGLVFSSSPDGCVETSAGGVRCEVGTLPDEASASRRVVAAVTDDGAISNTAQVAADSIDPVAGNDAGSATIDVDAPTGDTRRIFGIDRIETAVAASQDTYGDGDAGAVVLARDDTFPDALAGAPLAVANRAPLLLTSSGALDDRTATELARVLPSGGTVHLLGGTVALSPAVEAAVVDRGYEVVRYPGADRYETAVLIADALGDPGAVFVATGTNFPDALTSGAAAAELGGVIVLTAHDQMVPVTAGYLAEHGDVPRYAVGGPAATADPEATPVVGADRFATALAVATRFFEDPVVVGIAVGTNFPDALSGDTHIARRRAPMLLVGPDLLPGGVAAYLRANAASIRQVFLYGGEAAIAPQVEAEIGGALS